VSIRLFVGRRSFLLLRPLRLPLLAARTLCAAWLSMFPLTGLVRTQLKERIVWQRFRCHLLAAATSQLCRHTIKHRPWH
jgi:hypothetical protein